jgi:hypothetical protein
MTKNSGRGDSPPGKPSASAGKPRPKKRKTRRGTPKGKGTVKPKHGGRIGNPPFKPTEEQRIRVESYVAAGAQQWWIAKKLGIDRDTLRKHFSTELESGKESVDWEVGGSIAQKALAGNEDMMKFYAARRAGWKTTTAVEATGRDGGPIEYRNLSDEELDARIAALTANAAADKD